MANEKSKYQSERSVKKAIINGWRKCCPSCGKDSLFKSYLKVKTKCSNCQIELFHHRADDGPAYLTILIVGHVLAPLLLLTYTNFNPNPLVVASLFSIGCISLSLYLLPKLKGTIIGIQWAKEMHGFNLIKSNVSKERI
ncbi:MAG: DUF983 domain-containing protein [Paracoccaceae bacterium]|nr:DUF983 domain-containing protein [Paracoccaceae bacterium]